MKRILRILVGTVLVVIALVSVFLLVALVVYPAEYVRRVFAWRASDYGDYMNNFPMRTMEASPQPFSFRQNLREEEVAALFASVFGVEEFDAFLEQGGTQALIVIQDDAVLYERYFNGFNAIRC